MSINAAFIGCGEISQEHLLALQGLEGLSPVAYCDTNITRAQHFLQNYGGMYATENADDIFHDDRIDAVYICTHHDSHTSLALSACDAGKHVMMEKPLALTLSECHQIAENVERSGITLMTAFKFRYYPIIQRAKEFILSPLVVAGHVLDRRWPDDFWAQDPIKGGGNILSQGVHAMDLLHWFNGSEPERIYAEGGALTHPDATVADSVTVTIRFSNGGIGSLTQTDAGEIPFMGKFSYQILDGNRTIHLHDRLKRGEFYDGVKTISTIDEKEMGMIEENKEFIRALQTNTPPFTTVYDGIRASAMALAAVEAARTGQVQNIAY